MVTLATLALLLRRGWRGRSRSELAIYCAGAIPCLTTLAISQMHVAGMSSDVKTSTGLSLVAALTVLAGLAIWNFGVPPQSTAGEKAAAGEQSVSGGTGYLVGLGVMAVVGAIALLAQFGTLPPQGIWLNRDGARANPIEGRLLFEISARSSSVCVAKCVEYTNCNGVQFTADRCGLWEAKTPTGN
jgi:hypothetical protein